jgi:hypothetical protein
MDFNSVQNILKGFCIDSSKPSPPRPKSQAGWETNMAALQAHTLGLGKFAWQMLWTGGAADSTGNTCPGWYRSTHHNKNVCCCSPRLAFDFTLMLAVGATRRAPLSR